MLSVPRYLACLWNTLCFSGGCWTLWLVLLCIGIYTFVCYKVVIHKNCLQKGKVLIAKITNLKIDVNCNYVFYYLTEFNIMREYCVYMSYLILFSLFKNRSLTFMCFHCEGEASTSVYLSFYVIVMLPSDCQYKRPKQFVEEKWMHSIFKCCGHSDNKHRH